MSLEQISNAITFYAFYVASKVGKTGLLDVTVDVYNPAGAEIVTAGAATEVGDGLYSYTLASGSTGTVGEYAAIFKTADGTVDQQHIPALWVVGRAGIENLDATVGSRAAPGAAMNTTQWGGAAVGAMPNSVAPPAMITGQEVRDAMKLAPTVGAAAAGSVDTHLDGIQTDTGNLIARLGAFLGTTTNTVYGWLRAMMRKDVAAPSDIGGAYDPATDSGEGLRDTLPSAPAMITSQQVRDAMKLAPTGGAPATGSVDKHLDDIIAASGATPAQIADAVWEHDERELTQSPEDVAAAVSGTNLTIISAVTYDYTLTGLVIPADWKKIWVTLKTKRTDDDADSIVQIVESNPGVAADGLLYLNGAAGTKAQASLTVNQGAGTVAVHIDDEATAELARWTGGYDVKVLDDAGDTKQIRSAKVSVVLTETHAIA